MSYEVKLQDVLEYHRNKSTPEGEIAGDPEPLSRQCAVSLGWIMACKVCASLNLQKLTGEVSASFPDVKGASIPPIYVCKELIVCLDCGFTELVIPPPELEQLKMGYAASGS